MEHLRNFSNRIRRVSLGVVDRWYDHAPHIVFWNLRASGTPTFQADAAESGVSIMSGFSQQILKDFLEEGVLKNGKQITPLESLFTRLNKPCFQPIRDLCVEEELKIVD